MPPTLGNGKICYIEIPTTDVARSGDFYTKVFGWKTRKRGDGKLAFDDAVGEVSGTWTTDLPPNTLLGFVIYIMVDDMTQTIDLVKSNGGKLIEPPGRHAPEITARIADPFGNIWGLFQERGE